MRITTSVPKYLGNSSGICVSRQPITFPFSICHHRTYNTSLLDVNHWVRLRLAWDSMVLCLGLMIKSNHGLNPDRHCSHTLQRIFGRSGPQQSSYSSQMHLIQCLRTMLSLCKSRNAHFVPERMHILVENYKKHSVCLGAGQ